MKKIFLITLLLVFTLGYLKAQYIGSAPIRNGSIASGEYGDHTIGKNAWNDGARTWYMTWDNTNLYIAVSSNGNASSDEMAIFIDTDPQTTPNTGNGVLGGFGEFDGNNYGRLPFRAQFVAFVRNDYHQTRTNADNTNWNGANNNSGSLLKTNSGNLQEIQIEWDHITNNNGRPAAFNFFFYLNGTNPYGGLSNYGSDNDFTNNQNLTGRQFFNVASTENNSSTFPFSRKNFINQRSIETLNNYGSSFYGVYNADGQILELSGSATMSNIIRNEASCIIRTSNTAGATIIMNGGDAGSITNLGTFEADYLAPSGRIMNYSIEGFGTNIAINSANVDVFNLNVEAGATVSVGAGNSLRTGNTGTIRVKSGGKIYFSSTGVITEWAGISNFDLQSGGTLQTENAAGILSSTNTGSVQTDNRTYSDAGNYEFIAGNTAINAFTTTPTAATVNNLSINVTGTTAISGWSPLVNGTLNLTAGSLSLGSNTLSVNGIVSVGGTLTGSITSNLIINGGNNNLDFSGSGTNNYLKDLTLNNSAIVTLVNPLNITGGSNPGVVTITGTARLITNGNLVLKSDANGTASVAQVTSTGTAPVISGDVTVERYIPQAPVTPVTIPPVLNPQTGRAWRLLTIPVMGTTTIRDAWAGGNADRVNTSPAAPAQTPGVGTIITGHAFPNAGAANAAGYDWWPALWFVNEITGITSGGESSIKRYQPVANYAGNNWPSNVALRPVINTQLNNTDPAYMLFVRGDRTVTTGFGSTTLAPTGALRIGNVETSIPTTPQFFTYGNPYAATIDFGQLYDDHNLLIEAAMHVWDATLQGSKGLGGYRTIGKVGNDWVEIPFNIPVANIQFIHSSQGVMLKSLSAASGNITTKESYKVSGTPAISPFEVPGNNPSGLLFTNLYTRGSNGQLGLADGVLAVFDGANKADATDKNDISKLKNFTGDLGIALNQSGQYLTIEGRPVIKDGDKLLLAVTGLENKTYSFAFKPSEMQLEGREAFLVDKFLTTETPISLKNETRYDFEGVANEASKAVDRFEIVFKQSTILPVNITRVSAAEVQGNIKVSWNSATESGLKHYDVEHSVTGREFKKLGRVVARNVNGADYTFLHQLPGNGNHYYRLRSEDVDGKNTISQIVKVSLGEMKPGIVIYPNVINASNRITLQLNGLNSGKYQINLTDMGGRILMSQNIEHNGNASAQTITLPATLSAGKYLLHVAGNENSFTEALIKQ